MARSLQGAVFLRQLKIDWHYVPVEIFGSRIPKASLGRRGKITNPILFGKRLRQEVRYITRRRNRLGLAIQELRYKLLYFFLSH